MKYVIVNGDDFGASRGVNRGILEAHHSGILTSASLLVDTPASHEAVVLSQAYPNLSVGLHLCLTREDGQPLLDLEDSPACRAELERQWDRFLELMSRAPSHLDSHHNIHRDPRVLPLFQDLAERTGLPLREHSPVRYFSRFYGQWDGETHLEQIDVNRISQMLKTELGEGFTEFGCHPGYADDPAFPSSYLRERETELETLCDLRVRKVIDELHLCLVNFREAAALWGALK